MHPLYITFIFLHITIESAFFIFHSTCLLLLCAKEEIIQCYGLKVICKIIYDTQQRYIIYYCSIIHQDMHCITYSKYATFHDELLLKVKQKFLEVQQATSIEIFNCLYEVIQSCLYIIYVRKMLLYF